MESNPKQNKTAVAPNNSKKDIKSKPQQNKDVSGLNRQSNSKKDQKKTSDNHFPSIYFNNMLRIFLAHIQSSSSVPKCTVYHADPSGY